MIQAPIPHPARMCDDEEYTGCRRRPESLKNGNSYVSWSNAGYVALDNSDFQTASSHFSHASQLFYNEKNKHTVTEEVDLAWGIIIADYYSGDRKMLKPYTKFLRKHTRATVQQPL